MALKSIGIGRMWYPCGYGDSRRVPDCVSDWNDRSRRGQHYRAGVDTVLPSIGCGCGDHGPGFRNRGQASRHTHLLFARAGKLSRAGLSGAGRLAGGACRQFAAERDGQESAYQAGIADRRPDGSRGRGGYAVAQSPEECSAQTDRLEVAAMDRRADRFGGRLLISGRGRVGNCRADAVHQPVAGRSGWHGFGLRLIVVAVRAAYTPA